MSDIDYGPETEGYIGIDDNGHPLYSEDTDMTDLNPGLARIFASISEEAAATRGTRWTYDEAVTLLIGDRINRGILSNEEAQTIADWRAERPYNGAVDQPAPQPTKEQRYTDWTNGHDAGRTAATHELHLALLDLHLEAINELARLTADPVGPDTASYEQRLAQRSKSEGIWAAVQLVGKQVSKLAAEQRRAAELEKKGGHEGLTMR